MKFQSLGEYSAEAEDEMLLMSDQLLDVTKSKSQTKTFVRALCTLKVLKRFNELECKEAAS